MMVLAIFLAVFTQSLAGFGSALIAMALLPGIVGIQIATPLVALIAGFIEIFLLARYRTAFKLSSIWRVALASVFGIPIGVIALKNVDEKIILGVLGAVISGYALYALLDLRLPQLRHPAWALGFGFIAGLLGGAYNTSGPPVIVYGSCRRWLPAEFKSNLQGFFLLNSAVVIASHILSRNVTPVVLNNFLISLPAIGLGLLAGISLDKIINPLIYRKIVLVLLVIMGLRLILTA
jgi:uncharacterized membrane protein YfcA